MKTLLALLLLAQTAKPAAKPEPKPTPKFQFVAPDGVLVTSDAAAGKTVLVLPHAGYYNNLEARCVIIYPRNGNIGWLIDRQENTAEIFYVAMPWPAFCKEEVKK